MEEEMISSDDEYEFQEVDSCDEIFYDSTSEEHTVEETASSSSGLFPLWSDLPSPAIENIYLYLNRDDQCRVSLVCKNWSQEFGSPSIWRNVKFFLPEKVHSSGICPEVRWAQRYGHMFHSVEIKCKKNKLRLQRYMWQQLRLFLQGLIRHTQLSTLSFVNLARYFRLVDEIIFEDIFQSIADLLLAQDKLSSIEFRDVELKKHAASEILRLICLKHGGNLKNLNLDGFVKETSEDIVMNVVNSQMYYETLMNLQELTVDYSQIFENIITACFDYGNILDDQSRKGSLKTMRIACNGSSRVSYRGIPLIVWKYFRKTFPELRIDLLFYSGTPTRNRFEIFVVPHMPIRYLIFNWKKSNSSTERVEHQIGSIFQHIAWCESTGLLEQLIIYWPHNSTNMARDLLVFLRLCPRLKVLQLFIQHPVDSLDSVIKWWLEKGVMSLESACITVSNVQTTNEAQHYVDLADEYYPLLQVWGLNFILIVDFPQGNS